MSFGETNKLNVHALNTDCKPKWTHTKHQRVAKNKSLSSITPVKSFKNVTHAW